MEMLWSKPVLGLMVNQVRTPQLELSFESHVYHKCIGKDAVAQFSCALSRENNDCEVLLLFSFRRWTFS